MYNILKAILCVGRGPYNVVTACTQTYCLSAIKYAPPRLETYLRTCAPSEDSDQPAHSRSLIRIFTVRIFDS